MRRMTMGAGVLTLLIAAPGLAVAQAPAAMQATAAPAPAAPLKPTKVMSFDHQVTGITVTKDGRMFVNFPRWTEDTAVSLAEIKDGKLVPFPDAEWNSWRNAKKDEISARDHWVCLQAVVADHAGNIWVLDPAAPAMASVVKDGPKLVEIDLKTNKPGRTIAFDETAAPQGSYLNDVRFSPDDKTAFITDSGVKGALLVVDLTTGSARRVLDGSPSTQPDKSVTVSWEGKPLRRPDGRGVEFSADGIALSLDGRTLYWQAIKGKTLYAISTDALAGRPEPTPDANSGTVKRALAMTSDAFSGGPVSNVPDAVDRVLTSKVTTVGDNGPADGLMIADDGTMYVTSPQDGTIKARDLSRPDAPLTTVIGGADLHWPDTFSQGPDGTIYFTTSHIQDSAFFKPGAPAALPTELWSFKPPRRP